MSGIPILSSRPRPATITLVSVLIAGMNLARAQPADFTALAQNALPAVVNVSTTTEIQEFELEVPQLPPGLEEFFGEDFFERFFGQRRPNPMMTSLGSGFLIDPEGHVVTNNHVIERADKISVILQDKTEFEARVVRSASGWWRSAIPLAWVVP